VFCPNCGTQNESAATPCKKCGFKLSGVSVPKFKGTMMLNSEQTVQEMIEEHRRKQAAGGTSDRPKSRASEPPPGRNPPSNPPPPGSVAAPRGAVLQPPRAAAAPRRRMGGTMLGVAPQGGGVAAPPVELTAAPPPVRATEPPPAPAASGQSAFSEASPFAGTFEMPRAEHTPAEVSVGSAPDPSSISGPGHTRPFVMNGVTAGPGHTRPFTLEDAAGPGHTRPLQALPAEEDTRPEPPVELDPRPAVAQTVSLPQLPEPNSSAEDLAAESRVVPPRLRTLDIVLLVCTLGLYGFVLWARQRRAVRG
jgi:hypothetical protein